MAICEKCGKEHDGSYASGRFCCETCARTYSHKFVTPEGRANQIKALNDKENRAKAQESYRNSTKKPNKEIKKEKRYKELSSMKIGSIGELETMKRFTQRGIPVYTALTDDSGTDMIAEFGGKLQKIQVKTSQKQRSRNEEELGHIEFDLSRNIYDNGSIRHGNYTSSDVDYFSLYDANNDNLFLLKNSENVGSSVHIRYNYPVSKQVKNIKFYTDYEFDRVLDNIENGIDQNDVIYI